MSVNAHRVVSSNVPFVQVRDREIHFRAGVLNLCRAIGLCVLRWDWAALCNVLAGRICVISSSCSPITHHILEARNGVLRRGES